MTREELMREALAEARRGRGRTHPNPIVGAVVVRGGRVIARGHHERAGEPHAEVNALRAAGARARGADLYVTLEPCNHHGRTPPCTEAILAAGVRRVLVGSPDPNPRVEGRGAERLRKAGVEVVEDVVRDECDAALEGWFKFITRGLPWVVLKAAATLDGALATARGDSKWISSEESRALVHALRDELDAVLVGIGTARADDPQLTVRGIDTGRPLRNPVRVVVDARAQLSPRARMLREPGETLIACGPDVDGARLERAGAVLLRCRLRDARVDLRDLLRKLARRGLTSVLVEGGAAIHGAFLSARLWDELHLFLAPKLAGRGALTWSGFPGVAKMSAALALDVRQVHPSGPDLLVIARP